MPDSLTLYGFAAALPSTIPVTLQIPGEGPLCISVPLSFDSIDDDGHLIVWVDVSDKTLRDATNSAEERRWRNPRRQGQSQEYINVGPLRDEALRQVNEAGLSWYELAQRMGFIRPDRNGKGDTTRVKRLLGLSENLVKDDKTVKPEVAMQLCSALGVDPVDVGL
jgi:hypothetical protein